MSFTHDAEMPSFAWAQTLVKEREREREREREMGGGGGGGGYRNDNNFDKRFPWCD